MKAQELIALLNKCDPDATVKFDDMSYVSGGIDRSEVTAVYEGEEYGFKEVTEELPVFEEPKVEEIEETPTFEEEVEEVIEAPKKRGGRRKKA